MKVTRSNSNLCRVFLSFIIITGKPRISRQLQQYYLETHPSLAAFVCNLCQDLVQGGVITICGHLFCWVCLWPQLKRKMPKPRCPRCRYKLILHEDLIPFLGEGPHEPKTTGDVVAQPGNVPRPSGMYLLKEQYPKWFLVLPTDESLPRDERNLYMLTILLDFDISWISSFIGMLHWIQYVCIIVLAIIFGCLLEY